MTSESTDLGAAMLDGAKVAFQANKNWAEKAIAQTTNENMHKPLDENTNSIVVIMKHVAGNLRSRWTEFLTTDGEKEWRDRDDEFIDDFESRDQLQEAWEGGWHVLFETLDGLDSADLLKTVTIRGEPHPVPLAIQRSLSHSAYHCGQIILIARVHAGETWETITIPRGQSQSFNQAVWSKGHYNT